METQRQAYTFTTAERNALAPVFSQIDIAQSQLSAMVTLIINQQGLPGNYEMNADRSGISPKD